MAETTGSTANAYAGSSQDNTFGNNKYWMQWIEYENPTPVGSLTEIGFNAANGDWDPAAATVASTAITQAGGLDTTEVGAIASYIGETNANGSATELFATRFVTTLTIDTAGTYDLRMNSDDGSMLFIDGVQVINHDGLHDAGPQATTSLPLSAGQHDIVIIQYNYQGPSALNLFITGADYPVETEFDDIPLTHLQANAGDDTVFGGDGVDDIHGGEGADTLYGEGGADTLRGEAGDDVLIGGTGDDTLIGGSGADSFVITSGGGADVASDFNAAEDTLDTSGLDAALGRQLTASDVSVAEDGSGNQIVSFPGGESIQLPPGTLDLTTPKSQFDALVALGVPACFVPGTRIATPDGARPVEGLAPGDMVLTLGDGAQPILHVHRRFAAARDGGKHMPVRLSPGALGRDGAGRPLPGRALLLSPQHRIALALPEGGAGLTPARAFLGRPGAVHLTGAGAAVYVALLLRRHALILAEGAAVETFRPGPVALEGMSAAQRADLLAAAPFLARGAPTPCAPLLSVREGREALGRGASGFGAGGDATALRRRERAAG